MKPLIRSLMLGVFVGLVILVITGAWMDQRESADEPGLFPAAGTVLKRIAHGTRTRVIRDPHVQTPQDAAEVGGRVEPIAHHAPTTGALLFGATASQPSPTGPRITRVEEAGNSAIWQIDRSGQEVVLFKSEFRLILVSDKPGTSADIEVNGKPSANKPNVQVGPTEVSVPFNLEPGSYRLECRFLRPGETLKSTTSLIIRIADPNANKYPSPLDVDMHAVGKLSPLKKTGNSITVFGVNSVVRFAGSGQTKDTKLRFFQISDLDKLVREISDVRLEEDRSSEGRWLAETVIASENGFNGALAVVKQVNETTTSESFTVSTLNTDAINSPPSITNVSMRTALDRAGTSHFLLNTNNPIILIAAPPVHTHDLVLHAYVSDSDKPAASRYVDSAPANLRIPNLRDGRHEVTLRFQQGDAAPISARPVVFVVRTKGPSVLKVEPEKFGTEPGYSSLRVYFSPENPLETKKGDASNIDFKSMFSVLGSNGSGVFDRGSERELTAATNTSYSATYDESTNSVLLALPNLTPDIYQLTVKGGITDVFGNKLEGREGEQGTNFVKVLGRQPSDAEVAQGRGIVHTTGNFVPYQEFTQPRQQIDGFNPSDKVETRVARLYYYRDAHRVAQIINRKVKSYNRAGVDTSRQLADRARNVAEQKAVIRQQAERAAIEKAQKTRQKETELRRAENAHARTLEEITAARLQGTKLPMNATAEEKEEAQEKLDGLISQLESAASRFASQVEGLQEEVQQLRDIENEANELTQRAEAEERLSRDEQFRREVAAARADPDTYAEGKPTSDDPVEQVSVSVIGEGLIQLRGPIKGINIIRTMIDQIDSPVGQVRVAVHTVQLNGERADRIEEVSTASQLYIDQARFLTLQSGELLRRSVVQVAAMRADEARGLNAGETQEDRDQRYLYAYFGRDFVEELKAMDSEFLRTGNKLLSLHSMDTTSLSSALTLMALARNDTRMAILQQFEEFCRGELPMMEQGFFEQNMYCGLKKHHFGQLCKPPIVSLASNARFESLRGFFAADVAHQDTMTPLQREFLRLAQILKSRLIVEMELKQRVTERAIIEERLGNRLQELQMAAQREKEAEEVLDKVRSAKQEQQLKCVQAVQRMRAQATILAQLYEDVQNAPEANVARSFEVGLKEEIDEFIAQQRRFAKRKPNEEELALLDQLERIPEASLGPRLSYPKWERANPVELYWKYREQLFARVLVDRADIKPRYGRIRIGDNTYRYLIDKDRNDTVVLSFPGKEAEVRSKLVKLVQGAIESLNRGRKVIENYSLGIPAIRGDLTDLDTMMRLIDLDITGGVDKIPNHKLLGNLLDIRDAFDIEARCARQILQSLDRILAGFSELASILSDTDVNVARVYGEWMKLAKQLADIVPSNSPTVTAIRPVLTESNAAFEILIEKEAGYRQSLQRAQEARRPLDHKKFLDMLIDETEDKYIELLEGTRAHTANIDNYIKRLTTALDDDFNTQFYNPAFRLVRESSAKRYYNVQFGQIETTSILANNRAFAKVSPAASMEFDLPHRDIILTEAISGAKALMNDVGALANDPTFLAMAKLSAGQPSSVPAPGSTNGFSVVRNVVPGLGGETTEQVLAQNANGGQQFGSNLENLIPDPAIYKFETGTGYEIRPVIQPDGQAVVFDFQYLYSTQIREPVRADEKHLGRIKRHHIDTDVQLSNFELREVSKYIVALKASRTSRGVPLLEDIPIAGALFRPAPSDESSLQQNSVYAQATIFPTLFDLMGLRWAPVVADLDPLRMQTDEFTVRGRRRFLRNFVDGESSRKVDEFLRIPPGHRREDLYHPQETIPYQHPNGYEGPGGNRQDSNLREGYTPTQTYREQPYAPPASREGSSLMPYRRSGESPQPGEPPLQEALPRSPDPQPIVEPDEARIQGAGYRSYNSPSRIPGTSQSATGYSSSTRSASNQGMTPTPASGASLRRSWGPSSEPTPGATPTPAYSVSSPMPLGR